jgi:hypothetical protein
MACSKIFSGNLPELLNEITQYFRHDYKTLHSCILVNRLWCRLAIPLLWEDPFSIKFPKNYRFIEIYLHNLNDDDKTKLNEYGINNNLFPSSTLFNYPSFIQNLDTYRISISIGSWKTTKTNLIASTNDKLQLSNYSIRNSTFTRLIYRFLFLIFIENKVNLRSLVTHQRCDYFEDAFELILQNPNFICNIKDLRIDVNTASKPITKFLMFLNTNCNSISSLHYIFTLISNNNYSIIENNLSQIINSQENLKKILYGINSFPLYHSLLSLKNSNCSNTLNTIVFYYIDFKNTIVLNEVFNQLNVLESIHIVYCYSLDTQFIQQIINVIKPFKLKSLILNEISHIESLELLIQKFGNDLENFEINVRYEPQKLLQLLEVANNCCYKIKFLHLPIRLNNQNINLILNLIGNIKDNLNYLSIDADDSNNHLSSIILRNLGQILPSKLEYLDLGLSFNEKDFEIFLKNSQNIFIKKLLIKNKKPNESENIFPYIKEYIMKKKRVKYLAIIETTNKTSVDLFSQKDKVKEFELYDIQFLYYYHLSIDMYSFIKESYL